MINFILGLGIMLIVTYLFTKIRGFILTKIRVKFLDKTL